MKLEELNLGSEWKSKDSNLNAIGPEGAKAIGEALKTNKNISIAELNLERTSYMIFFFFNPFIADNEIGYEGCKAIGEALKENTKLTKLDLRLTPTKVTTLLYVFYQTTKLEMKELWPLVKGWR